jgi:hypothetical protein
MLSNPIDISSRVSPELSSLIETLISQFETDEPITLSTVRSFIRHEMPEEFDEDENMHHFDVAESVIDELDMLIGQFGESAAAMDFTSVFASEGLTRVIEVMMNDDNREAPPTLEDVHTALLNGLGARLVGEGVLDEDEDDILLSELENLIDQHGHDALAEEFLRYE